MYGITKDESLIIFYKKLITVPSRLIYDGIIFT
jgi:hypothetical protein